MSQESIHGRIGWCIFLPGVKLCAIQDDNGNDKHGTTHGVSFEMWWM